MSGYYRRTKPGFWLPQATLFKREADKYNQNLLFCRSSGTQRARRRLSSGHKTQHRSFEGYVF